MIEILLEVYLLLRGSYQVWYLGMYYSHVLVI